MNTPSYIKSLVTPTTKAATGRKVWSLDLTTVVIPFFTATNTQGDTAIPHDALGAPLRLAYDKAGAVRFSQSGKPVIRVAKELSDGVRMIRDNLTANMVSYANDVARDNAEAFKHTVELTVKAGAPVIKHDHVMLDLALRKQAEAEAEAEAAKAEAVEQANEITAPRAEAEAIPA